VYSVYTYKNVLKFKFKFKFKTENTESCGNRWSSSHFYI